jgi:hypothetical protein
VAPRRLSKPVHGGSRFPAEDSSKRFSLRCAGAKRSGRCATALPSGRRALAKAEIGGRCAPRAKRMLSQWPGESEPSRLLDYAGRPGHRRGALAGGGETGTDGSGAARLVAGCGSDGSSFSLSSWSG